MTRALAFAALLTLGLVGLLTAASRIPAARPRNLLAPEPYRSLDLTPRRKQTVAVARPRPNAPRGTWLAIVYGGNGQGEIEPCG